MSLDMQHAFEREFNARYADMSWRTEAEAFGRGWAACLRHMQQPAQPRLACTADATATPGTQDATEAS